MLGGLNCFLMVVVSDKGMLLKCLEYVVVVYIIIEEINKYKVKFDFLIYYVVVVENMFVGVIIFIVCVVIGMKKLKLFENIF